MIIVPDDDNDWYSIQFAAGDVYTGCRLGEVLAYLERYQTRGAIVIRESDKEILLET